MSGRGKERSSEPMKVVFINTQYVETDARSFKTVVQQLTGKDATVAADPSDPPAASAAAYNQKGYNVSNSKTQFYGGEGTDQLDRFFREMLPAEELYKLWSDN